MFRKVLIVFQDDAPKSKKQRGAAAPRMMFRKVLFVFQDDAPKSKKQRGVGGRQPPA